jgi:hypothetical protein
MNLDDLVTQLRTEKADWLARAATFYEGARKAEAEAELLAARIQGIEEARAALADPRLGAVLKPPRRDIRAMVSEALPKLQWAITQDEKVRELSKMLGCRPSQIEAALRAINGPDPDLSKPHPGSPEARRAIDGADA